MTSGAIQYGVPFIDLAPETVAYTNAHLSIRYHIRSTSVQKIKLVHLIGK